MDATIWWVLLLVVGLIAGPFATLRAVSAFRARRGTPQAAAAIAKEDDEKKNRGSFW
jgi:hypothetical protein